MSINNIRFFKKSFEDIYDETVTNKIEFFDANILKDNQLQLSKNLVIKNLSFNYGSKQIFENLNFWFRSLSFGEMGALITFKSFSKFTES